MKPAWLENLFRRQESAEVLPRLVLVSDFLRGSLGSRNVGRRPQKLRFDHDTDSDRSLHLRGLPTRIPEKFDVGDPSPRLREARIRKTQHRSIRFHPESDWPLHNSLFLAAGDPRQMPAGH